MSIRLLKAAKLEAAEDAYTEAISLDPSVYTYWNNRAMCKMKRSNAEVSNAAYIVLVLAVTD